MFELSVALKYLIPRWRQLSVSIISLISILVISLVVWLILVFFSVTQGLEKNWIQKLIALTAPVRMTPTEEYYHSYYYLVDSISADSDYSVKTIGEKLLADTVDPYNPEMDEALPEDWPAPEAKNIVQEAFAAIQEIPGTKARDFEITMTDLRLRLVRDGQAATISQGAYLGSLDEENTYLAQSILPLSPEDQKNAIGLPCVLCHPKVSLPEDPAVGDGVLLPRGFKDSGVLVGDRGHLAYYTPTTSAVQEQQIPIYVAGFYDPGIIPIGGKYLIASQDVASLIRSSSPEEAPMSNGINVRFQNLDRADEVKAKIERALQKRGIDKYWKVETFREFEFAKDVLQQLQTEKHLFMIISTVIIIVACSNIISMLIILVNDKKKEIGILRSMGATSRSIATIFGTCGIVMGLMGSVIGTGFALYTLNHLQALIDLLSAAQGHEAFNPMFYGSSMPNEISYEALKFVLVSTTIISLLAGIIPAVKASLLQPTETLRAE